jgi:ribosomal silencing factor RsfS
MRKSSGKYNSLPIPEEVRVQHAAGWPVYSVELYQVQAVNTHNSTQVKTYMITEIYAIIDFVVMAYKQPLNAKHVRGIIDPILKKKKKKKKVNQTTEKAIAHMLQVQIMYHPILNHYNLDPFSNKAITIRNEIASRRVEA